MSLSLHLLTRLRLLVDVGTVAVEEYDTTQGEPVAQKEVARHSEQHTAFESEKTAHDRAEDIGSQGGAAT